MAIFSLTKPPSRRMAGEVILGVAYGIKVLPVDDPYIALAERAVQSAAEASIPGRFMVVRTS